MGGGLKIKRKKVSFSPRPYSAFEIKLYLWKAQLSDIGLTKSQILGISLVNPDNEIVPAMWTDNMAQLGPDVYLFNNGLECVSIRENVDFGDMWGKFVLSPKPNYVSLISTGEENNRGYVELCFTPTYYDNEYATVDFAHSLLLEAYFGTNEMGGEEIYIDIGMRVYKGFVHLFSDEFARPVQNANSIEFYVYYTDQPYKEW